MDFGGFFLVLCAVQDTDEISHRVQSLKKRKSHTVIVFAYGPKINYAYSENTIFRRDFKRLQIISNELNICL